MFDRANQQVKAHRPGIEAIDKSLDAGDGACLTAIGQQASPIQRAMDSLNDAAECVMKEIAGIAETIDPVLSQEKATTTDSMYGPSVMASEGESMLLQRVCEQARLLYEAARTLEALRRRVQL